MTNKHRHKQRYRRIDEKDRVAWWHWRQMAEQAGQEQQQEEEAEENHGEQRKRRIAGQFALLRAAAAEQQRQEQQAEALLQQQNAQAWDDVFRFVMTMQQFNADRDLDR